MAAQWFVPGDFMPVAGGMVDEDGTDEYFIPGLGMFNENQAAAAAGRIMGSIAGKGGLAGPGGIAGIGGGLAA